MVVFFFMFLDHLLQSEPHPMDVMHALVALRKCPYTWNREITVEYCSHMKMKMKMKFLLAIYNEKAFRREK